jgi:hypothetical protein
MDWIAAFHNQLSAMKGPNLSAKELLQLDHLQRAVLPIMFPAHNQVAALHHFQRLLEFFPKS